MAKIPLQTSVSATVAGGRAVGRLTPGVAGSKWIIRRMTTTCTTGPDVPVELNIYRNLESEATNIDHTSSAGKDTSEIPDPGIEFASTETLLAVWSGVADGTICTLIISGDNITGRP